VLHLTFSEELHGAYLITYLLTYLLTHLLPHFLRS